MLRILGIVFLVILALLAGLLVWGYLKGSGMQEDFFEAVLSGDSARLLDLLHPDLRDRVDEPLLATWMAYFAEKTGRLEGLEKSNFGTHTANGVTTSKGTVSFERGDVESEIVMRDDKIVSFQLRSGLLEEPWLPRLRDTGFLRERAREFLSLLAGGDAPGAFARMHPALRREMPLERLESGLRGLLADAGELRSIDFEREEFTSEGGQSLVVYFLVEFARGRAPARVRFGPVEFRGEIVGFDLPHRPR